MKRVYGVSCFGLQDCVQNGGACVRKGFYLADAVLPEQPLGPIRTGDEAEEERVHSGLYWPPEARVSLGQKLRRAPIPVVWRGLVEAGERQGIWRTEYGGGVPLGRILARHVADLVREGVSKQDDASPVATTGNGVLPVVAIPNHLDEAGQESFLRGLRDVGYPDSLLVWRPVAIALAWLSGANLCGENVNPDDHIHVVYLGADAFEFTTFRLRVWPRDFQKRCKAGRIYILPRRDRPVEPFPEMTGLDWADQLIKTCCPGVDPGAYWQAFTTFPEVWESMAGRNWNKAALPRPWRSGGGWSEWPPSSRLWQQPEQVSIGAGAGMLRTLLEPSCSLSVPRGGSGRVEDLLCCKLRELARKLPQGELEGVVLCGPLLPQSMPEWLRQGLDGFRARGLSMEGDIRQRERGCLWYCGDCEDPAAEGATIYGQRVLAREPTYLDTLPQMSLMAEKLGRYSWHPLLNAEEVLGGEEISPKIKGKFFLKAQRKELKILLYKGAVQSAPQSFEATAETLVPRGDVPPCWARYIRAVVQHLGSEEKVARDATFARNPQQYADYERRYAQLLYGSPDAVHEEASQANEEKPYREAVVSFPQGPSQDVLLDVHVRMKPASGLAKVEFVPQDAAFLMGQKVRLNYSTMRATARLPRGQRGWPAIQELVVDPEDISILQLEHFVRRFESTPIDNTEYLDAADNVRDRVIKGTVPVYIDGRNLILYNIDTEGKACGAKANEIIDRIVQKFSADFRAAWQQDRTLRDKIMTRASWLYLSAPSEVAAYAQGIMVGAFRDRSWGWAVEAGSRIFNDGKQFDALFSSIARRAEYQHEGGTNFPIASQRAITRVLMFREKSIESLTPKNAKLFVQQTVRRLQEENEKQNYSNLFFQSILLLLYLLRIRKIDASCFNPEDDSSLADFYEAIGYINSAIEHFKAMHKMNNVIRTKKVLESYNKYLHYEATEDVPTAVTELAGSF